jgi:hypothetical protein
LSNTAKVLSVGLATVGLIVLFIALQRASDDDAFVPSSATTASGETGERSNRSKSKDSKERTERPAEPQIPTIEIEGGQPAGGVQELRYASGSRIQFQVVSDVDDEVHLHGYDVSMGVAAGRSARFDVPASIEGIFELELERSGVPIAEVSVVP